MAGTPQERADAVRTLYALSDRERQKLPEYVGGLGWITSPAGMSFLKKNVGQAAGNFTEQELSNLIKGTSKPIYDEGLTRWLKYSQKGTEIGRQENFIPKGVERDIFSGESWKSPQQADIIRSRLTERFGWMEEDLGRRLTESEKAEIAQSFGIPKKHLDFLMEGK